MQGSAHACGISKLNKSKDIIAHFVWILSSPSDSGIKNNTTFESDFEETDQILEVDILNGMDPNGSFISVRV